MDAAAATNRTCAPGDSDWEESSGGSDSSYDPENEAASDGEWDYVSTSLDASSDADLPLGQALLRGAARNAPGTAGFVWKKRENVIRREGFRGQPGVKVDHLTLNSSAMDIFNAFFTAELWTIMKEETNRYAQQNPLKPSPHMKAWKETSEGELRKFVGLRLLMGIQRRPQQHHYWSTHPLLTSDLFKLEIPRDRYMAVKRNLHFADNTTADAQVCVLFFAF